MSRTADQKREILRRFIQDAGLKIARWAKESGVPANSLYNFLNGHSQALDQLTYSKLARSAQVPVWKLNGDEPEQPSPTAVWVSGHVEAGAWQEAVQWDEAQWYAIDVPTPARFRSKAKALAVRGSSMNREYPDGSIAIWVDVLDFRPPRDGDDVVAYQHHQDDVIEATIKRFRQIDGTDWLWPISDDPMHQTPVNTQAPGADVKWVEVRGIVIGGYRPRVF